MTDFSRRIVVRGRVYELPDAAARDEALSRVPERLRAVVSADSAEAAAERRSARLYGDSPVRAGLAGAARNATLGLSDTALTSTGLVDPETLRELERRNQIASLLGEGAGAIAPVLLAGPLGAAGEVAEGGSLLARGGRLLSTPTRLLAGASEAAGGAVTRAVTGAGTSATRRLLGRATGLAVEGGIDGAVSEAARLLTTESAMGYEPDVTAEALLSRIGTGALFGAGAGGVLGGIGGVAGEGVRASRRIASSTADNLSRAYRETTGAELSPSLARVMATLGEGTAETNEEVIRRGLLSGDPSFHRTIERGDRIYEEGTGELRNAVSEMERAREAIVRHWATGELRVGHLEGMVNPGNIAAQAATAREAAERARDLLDSMVTDAALYAPGVGAAARRARGTIEAHIHELELTMARTGASDARRSAEIFSRLDRIKRDLGALQRQFGRGGGEATDAVRREYERLAPVLEDAGLWGDEAAAMQRTVNAAYTRELTTRGRFADRFLEVGGTQGGRSDVDPFDLIGQGDSGRIAAFLNGAGTAANATAEETFSQTVDSTRRLLAAMGDHMDLPARERRLLERALRSADTAEEVFDRVRSQARDLNQWRQFQQNMGIGRTVLSAAIGSGIAGPLGAVAAGVLTNPVLAIRTRGMIERIAGDTLGDLSSSVRRFLGGATRAAREGGRRTVRAAVLGGAAAYNERMRRLEEESANPRTAMERIAANLEGADVAPEVRDALSAAATRANAYLMQHRPSQRAGTSLTASRSLPSRSEMDRFLRRARAIDDPQSVIRDLERGAVTREAVEALAVAYPRMYERIRSEVMRQVSEDGDRLSYARRLALGILLDLPTVPSLAPDHIATVQSMYAESAAATPPAPRPTGTAPRFAESMASGMDALEMRRAA